MAFSRCSAGITCLLLLACIGYPALNASAQSRDLGARALVLDDGAGHSLRITAPTTGWPSSGQFEWVLSMPPTGVDGGFVEAGTALLNSLEWDDVNQYWKAVSASSTLSPNILALPTTTSTAGQITINSQPFMHAYGLENTFLGQNAGNFTMTGEANTGIGANALASNQTGNFNTAIGRSAMGANTTARYNVAVGYAALLDNTTGEMNTAVGSHSLLLNTAFSNTGVGTSTLLNNTTGSNNTAIGSRSMESSQTGSDNSSLGNRALFINTIGAENTAIGANALQSVTTGSNNTALGSETNVASGALTNTTALGYQAIATASNQIMLGNANVTQIQSTGGLLLNGTTGTTPTSGAGTRLMWIPAKAAFRAGTALSTQWDDANVGSYSIAAGHATVASGSTSVAMGSVTTASGLSSTAFGSGTNALGQNSTALGSFTLASGIASISMGMSTIASSNYSTAMGRVVSTSIYEGSFIYGDNSSGNVTTYNTAANQFMVRAAGGTVFYSSSDLSTGVTLAAGGAAWASISDSNRKANRLNIDGEAVLNKLSNIWLGSWNYKTQDKTMRHYGPMAQEFFAAFGNDGLGVIGNDTTLATSDVDGVTLIAVKALIERNDALTSRVELLEAVIRKMAGSQDATIQKALLRK